jgi:hygromycin-B 7''-O-kinase
MLPPVGAENAFAAVCQDEAALRPGVEQLCRRLGVDVASLTRFEAGSRPVYAVGDLVLKLFPPTDLAGCRVEAGVLDAVRGKVPVLTPRVHAVGEHDGWGYVLMSRLPGVALDTVWGRISGRDRDVLAVQLGGTIAVLHQLPPPEIPGWWPADWPTFVARRRAECVSEQRSLGLPEPWAAQLAGFLPSGRVAATPARAGRPHAGRTRRPLVRYGVTTRAAARHPSWP